MNNQTHKEDERRRLEEGQEGCGCSICQELYKTMDLTKYGSRVKDYSGIIVIGAKITRPEKPVTSDRQDAVDKKQGVKLVKVKVSRGRRGQLSLLG